MTLYVASPPTQQDLKLIGKTILTEAASSISVSIPEGYTYFRIVCNVRATGNQGAAPVMLRINEDSAANYAGSVGWIATTAIGNTTATTGFPMTPNSTLTTGTTATMDVILVHLASTLYPMIAGVFSAGVSTGIVRGNHTSVVRISEVNLSIPSTTFTIGSTLYVYGSI